MAIPAATSASTATTSAAIVSADVPLEPPSESLTTIVGAGASDDSDPDQLTIEPSE
jgi:hypothetical protein